MFTWCYRKQTFRCKVATLITNDLQVALWASERKTRYFHLSRSLKKLGRFVGRGNKESIVKAVMENPHLRTLVVRAVSKEVQSELKEICSDRYDTILRMKYNVALENFTWSRVWKELQSKTPTLLEILSGDGPVQPSICTCASILLKLRNPKVNLVQAMVSVVLMAGHANTQVIVDAICTPHTDTPLNALLL